MRLLVDVQLPPGLCDWLRGRGHEAEHVFPLLGGETPDRAIAAYVEEYALTLVTKDDDFLTRHPPRRSRLLWLRCGNISNRALRVWLDARWPTIEQRLAEGDTVIEVR